MAVKKLSLGPGQLEAVAKLFGVLAEPTRLAILQLLRDGPQNVGSIVEILGGKQANISKQLGILHEADLVQRQRTGNFVEYAIADPVVFQLCEAVCEKIRRDTESAYSELVGKPRRQGAVGS